MTLFLYTIRRLQYDLFLNPPFYHGTYMLMEIIQIVIWRML